VGDKEQTTPAGQYLTRRMAEVGYKTKSDLADRAGVSRSTITRLYSNPEYRPDIHNMRRLAGALDVDPEVLVAAIYGESTPTEPADLHPLAAELGRMLADDSPLSVSGRALHELLIDRAMEPARAEMRGKQPPQNLRVGDTVISKTPEGRVRIEPAAQPDDNPDPLEAKFERLQLLAYGLNPSDVRRLADSVQLLLEWVDARQGVPEMTDHERRALEDMQRAANAHNRALREHLAGDAPASESQRAGKRRS
jgi:transcriptional regulator with XRE-family HTH domain